MNIKKDVKKLLDSIPIDLWEVEYQSWGHFFYAKDMPGVRLIKIFKSSGFLCYKYELSYLDEFDLVETVFYKTTEFLTIGEMGQHVRKIEQHIQKTKQEKIKTLIKKTTNGFKKVKKA